MLQWIAVGLSLKAIDALLRVWMVFGRSCELVALTPVGTDVIRYELAQPVRIRATQCLVHCALAGVCVCDVLTLVVVVMIAIVQYRLPPTFALRSRPILLRVLAIDLHAAGASVQRLDAKYEQQ
jgi:hypothetical protein